MEKKSYSEFVKLNQDELKDWLLSFCTGVKTRALIEQKFLDDEEQFLNGRAFSIFTTPPELQKALAEQFSLAIANGATERIDFDAKETTVLLLPDASAKKKKKNRPVQHRTTGFLWPRINVDEVLEHLSQSSHAGVFRIKAGNLVCIMKAFHHDQCNHAENEKMILSMLAGHNNIVSLLGHGIVDKTRVLLLEEIHVEGYFHPSSEMELKSFMRQLFQTLQYLHGKRIIHADIKLENVLWIRKRERLVLIDFSHSIRLSKRRQSTKVLGGVGTVRYMAPEIQYKSYPRSFPADIWSAGILFGSLLGLPLRDCVEALEIRHLSSATEVVQWSSAEGPRDLSLVTDDACSLLKLLLQEDPARRCTAAEALVHSYLSKNR